MKTMDAGLDLGELARLHTEALRTEAVCHGDPDALWALQEWQGAEAGYKTAARNAMPDLLALASQAETLRREWDGARANLVDLGDQVYVLTAQRDEALESERLATECFTEAFARADTLTREVKARGAEIAALKEALAPFGAEAEKFSAQVPDTVTCGMGFSSLSVGHFRRAARLAPANGEKGPDDA